MLKKNGFCTKVQHLEGKSTKSPNVVETASHQLNVLSDCIIMLLFSWPLIIEKATMISPASKESIIVLISLFFVNEFSTNVTPLEDLPAKVEIPDAYDCASKDVEVSAMLIFQS